jgi:virginiamycin B lyase
MDGVWEFAPPIHYPMIPDGIIAGPNGHMWYPVRGNNAMAIAEIDGNGVNTVHPIPAPFSEIHAITLGPDGALWFTLTVGGTLPVTVDTEPHLVGGTGAVGRMTADGHVDEFDLPDPTQQPDQITSFEGQLWLSTYLEPNQSMDQAIWRVSTAGVFKRATSPGAVSQFLGDTSRSAGRLWYATFQIGPGYRAESGIGYLDPAGQPHPVALPDTLQGDTLGIVIGPDGNPWYLIAFGPDRIVRVRPNGTASVVATPQCRAALARTAHDVWCASPTDIFQVNATGTVITHDARLNRAYLSLGSSLTLGMVNGAAASANGSVWFTDPNNDRILRY